MRPFDYWKESCIPVTIYVNQFDTTEGFSVDKIANSVSAAAHAWSPDAVSCEGGSTTTHPYLEIVPTLAPTSANPPDIGWDHRNAIIFRTENWTKSGKPSGTKDYMADALAVTSVTTRADGHIVDVDIEVNAVMKDWINLDPGVIPTIDPHNPTREIHDLQNTLTHEFGHLLGLDHTCFMPGGGDPDLSAEGKMRPLSDKGDPIPNCDGAPPEVENTVMFSRAASQEVSKRVLSEDEVRFLCEVYPADRNPNVCEVDHPTNGCVVARAPAAPRGRPTRALGLLAAGAFLFAAARRRSRPPFRG